MNDYLTNNRLSPKRSITIYSNKHDTEFFLENREIKCIEGKFMLMAPVPMSDNVLKEVARSYMKTNSFEMRHEQIIGNHLLYASNKPGRTIVMWYRPATKRNLNFSAALKIKGESLVEIPATLYLVINNALHLYALMTSDKPDLQTKIYSAPFFNIYEDGNVCLGTAHIGKVKARTFEGEAERFERAFYMAEQNGGDHNNCKTPLTKLWTTLIAKKAPFPAQKELIQHKKYKTVGELVNKLITNQNEDDYDDEDFEEN